MVMTAVTRQKEMMLNNMLNRKQVQVLEDDRMSLEELGDNPKSDFVIEESFVEMPAMPGGVHVKKNKAVGGSGVALGRSMTRVPTLELSQANKPMGSQTNLSRHSLVMIESSRTDLRDGREGVYSQRERFKTQTSGQSRPHGMDSETFELKKRIGDIMREVSRGKLSDEDVEEKFKERLRNLPVNIQDAKGLEEFDFLKAYTQKKAEAWEKIIHILKSYLFYNKHNMRDVIDCLMYIAGLKHVQLVPMCERFSSQLTRRYVESVVRELSIQDILVAQIKHNLRWPGVKDY